MLHWPYWLAGSGLLLSAGLQLYAAFRAGGGAAPSEADRLRRRGGIAAGGGAALYGAVILYQTSEGPGRYETFIAGSVAFTALALAGIYFRQRAREMEAREASA